ncbi:hypothetical protein HV211_06765 [Citrobacter freundii]|uniref:hypothetical protein n=1 Tax=Citrobacter freundii TaxID=546 RepID=UPI0015E90741|nr:hypothetical protein [Citrobacter freundii]QLY60196.1 hypothetical protein HV211_06765 [Citrobacter freundii]
MRKNERKWMIRFAYFTPAIGVLLGLLYHLIKGFFGVSLGFVNIQGIATIVAGFSFTMLGFLAAIAAFMFSLQKYVFFRRWINDGGADVFFVLYKVAIVCLFITFSLSLIVFTNLGAALAFKLMLMFAIDNIIQTMILALVISGKVALAKKEDS